MVPQWGVVINTVPAFYSRHVTLCLLFCLASPTTSVVRKKAVGRRLLLPVLLLLFLVVVDSSRGLSGILLGS